MTDCPRADMRDLLPDLMHDTLDAASRAEVERHVRTCESCAQELALLRSLRDSLSAAPAIDVTRIAAAVNLARNTAPVAGRARGATAGWRHDWRIAAAFLLAALGAGGYAFTRAAQRGTIAPAVQVASRTGQSGPAPATSHTDTDAAHGAPANAPPPSRGVATPSAAGASPAAVATPSAGLMLGAGVNDLPAADIQALLDAVNQMDAIPRVDPAPVLEPAGEDIL